MGHRGLQRPSVRTLLRTVMAMVCSQGYWLRRWHTAEGGETARPTTGMRARSRLVRRTYGPIHLTEPAMATSTDHGRRNVLVCDSGRIRAAIQIALLACFSYSSGAGAQEACRALHLSVRPIEEISRTDITQYAPVVDSAINHYLVLHWSTNPGPLGDLDDSAILRAQELRPVLDLAKNDSTVKANLSRVFALLLQGSATGTADETSVVAAALYRHLHLPLAPAQAVLVDDRVSFRGRRHAVFALWDDLRDTGSRAAALAAYCDLADRIGRRQFVREGNPKSATFGMNTDEMSFLESVLGLLDNLPAPLRVRLRGYTPLGSRLEPFVRQMASTW